MECGCLCHSHVWLSSLTVCSTVTSALLCSSWDGRSLTLDSYSLYTTGSSLCPLLYTIIDAGEVYSREAVSACSHLLFLTPKVRELHLFQRSLFSGLHHRTTPLFMTQLYCRWTLEYRLNLSIYTLSAFLSLSMEDDLTLQSFTHIASHLHTSGITRRHRSDRRTHIVSTLCSTSWYTSSCCSRARRKYRVLH